MGAALIRMVIWDQYPPTTPSLSESVSAVLLSVSDFFVEKYLVQYQLLLWRSLQIRHYLANKETKVQLRINEHEDAFKHIRWTSSITVFSFSSLFFWQAMAWGNDLRSVLVLTTCHHNNLQPFDVQILCNPSLFHIILDASLMLCILNHSWWN